MGSDLGPSCWHSPAVPLSAVLQSAGTVQQSCSPWQSSWTSAISLHLISPAVQSLQFPGPRTITGSMQTQTTHKSHAMRGPTPMWNYKGFLPLQGHQMLVFHIFGQHLSGEHQEASGTIATTLLSEEREAHCRSASMILLLFVLVCIALVLQEWQEFQVEVTGNRKLILTVDLKHRGEPVGETLDPAAACSTSNPTGPGSLCCFRCWESHMDLGNFFTCPAGFAQQAMHALPEEMPQIGRDLLQNISGRTKDFRISWQPHQPCNGPGCQKLAWTPLTAAQRMMPWLSWLSAVASLNLFLITVALLCALLKNTSGSDGLRLIPTVLQSYSPSTLPLHAREEGSWTERLRCYLICNFNTCFIYVC